jgi:hypothetical protein
LVDGRRGLDEVAANERGHLPRVAPKVHGRVDVQPGANARDQRLCAGAARPVAHARKSLGCDARVHARE